MKQFSFIGFDHPEYWSGYPYPTVAVPVYGPMTNKEVVDAINEELNACFSLFEEIWDDEHERMMNEYLEKLMEEPDATFVKPDDDYEVPGEDDCFPVWNLYFSWCEPVVKYGIQFLNP